MQITELAVYHQTIQYMFKFKEQILQFLPIGAILQDANQFSHNKIQVGLKDSKDMVSSMEIMMEFGSKQITVLHSIMEDVELIIQEADNQLQLQQYKAKMLQTEIQHQIQMELMEQMVQIAAM